MLLVETIWRGAVCLLELVLLERILWRSAGATYFDPKNRRAAAAERPVAFRAVGDQLSWVRGGKW